MPEDNRLADIISAWSQPMPLKRVMRVEFATGKKRRTGGCVAVSLRELHVPGLPPDVFGRPTTCLHMVVLTDSCPMQGGLVHTKARTLVVPAENVVSAEVGTEVRILDREAGGTVIVVGVVKQLGKVVGLRTVKSVIDACSEGRERSWLGRLLDR